MGVKINREKIEKLIKFHMDKMQLEMQRFANEVFELKYKDLQITT